MGGTPQPPWVAKRAWFARLLGVLGLLLIARVVQQAVTGTLSTVGGTGWETALGFALVTALLAGSLACLGLPRIALWLSPSLGIGMLIVAGWSLLDPLGIVAVPSSSRWSPGGLIGSLLLGIGAAAVGSIALFVAVTAILGRPLPWMGLAEMRSAAGVGQRTRLAGPWPRRAKRHRLTGERRRSRRRRVGERS